MKSFKTFSTVLEEDNAKEIIEYFEETAGSYGFLKRCTLHILNSYKELNEYIELKIEELHKKADQTAGIDKNIEKINRFFYDIF